MSLVWPLKKHEHEHIRSVHTIRDGGQVVIPGLSHSIFSLEVAFQESITVHKFSCQICMPCLLLSGSRELQIQHFLR
jgi:hypothetical protein